MGVSYKIIIISLLFLYSCDDLFLSEKDKCDVVGGDNSSCADCSGMPNGSALEDECGVCDTDSSNDCILDCFGEWGGLAMVDICGVCNGSAISEYSCDCENTAETRDCLGVCGGIAAIDECGVCNGDNSLCTGCMISGADNFSANNAIENNESCFVDYESSVQTIFNNHCIQCHGSSGNVNLESYSNLINSNMIQQGDSTSSILWQVIQGESPSMPPGNPLSDNQVHKIALWIQLGAQEVN